MTRRKLLRLMGRYLCQLCYTIVNYGERHRCFFYKDEENAYSLPAFSASDETGSKQSELVTNSNDNSVKHFQAKQLNCTENSQKIRAYVTEDNRHLSFRDSSKTKGQFNSFSGKTSNTLQSENPSSALISDLLFNSHVLHSTVNKTASLLNLPENVESLYSSKGDLHGASRRKSRHPDLWKRNGYKQTHSTSLEEAFKEMHETSENAGNRYSYIENEISLSKSLKSSSQKSKFPSENASAARNFLPSLVCPSRLMETGQHEIIVSGDDSNNDADFNNDTFIEESNATSHKGGLNSIKFPLPIGVSEIFVFPRGQMGENNNEEPQKLHTSEVDSQGCDNRSNGFAENAVSRISLSDVDSIPGPSDMNLEAQRLVVDKRFICTKCGKRFHRKDHLNYHYLTHTTEKPFSCDICEYKGRLKRHLNVHRRSHTGERPFKCSECGKDFCYNSSLIRHYKLVQKKGF